MMREKVTAMVMASFLGDSLALGAHWIYDTGEIKRRFGRVDDLLPPPRDSYHSTKTRGEFTHYGDQAFILLESMSPQRAFNLEEFSQRWKRLFADYQGYYDQATRGTLQNFSRGRSPRDSGTPSLDLAGASRIAPLVFRYREDLESLIQHAREQTQMTHNHPLVIDSAEFFSRVVYGVLGGESPVSVMEGVISRHFTDSPLSGWVLEGIGSRDMESVQAIMGFGQSCHTDQAFPGVVHLIARYESDLQEALVQSVMAGGDSAARGMLVGMILGAHLGSKALPATWISGLARGEEIMKLLDSLNPPTP